MQSDCSIPEWLHDIFLGYGDPAAAHYSSMPNKLSTIDFNDTFIDKDHLKETFSKKTIQGLDEVKIPPTIVYFKFHSKKKKKKIIFYLSNSLSYL